MNDAPLILGRQPETVYIIPSKPNPWYGLIDDDPRFTVQQRRALDEAGIDPTTVETITVERKASSREMWWPKGSPPPRYRFECPVRARRGDRVKVLAPAGLDEWIGADGFAGRSTTKSKRGQR